ncbi:MAG TPA: hypothetical protein VFP65_17500 [Anaeromyxobacteraceae bacterium]|nr:hypothetical protein [Anaeromyxobacteraceae bacterium]
MKAAAALALVALAARALAALALPASVEDLARSSDAVVRGTVLAARSRWTADRLRIVTAVELQVAIAWRGAAPARVEVLVPGGVVGDLGQRVDGMATFAPGEEVVAFLVRPGPARGSAGSSSSGAWRVAGGAQGKFTVSGSRARPDLARTTFLEAPLAPGERRAEEMPIAELERRVRAAR